MVSPATIAAQLKYHPIQHTERSHLKFFHDRSQLSNVGRDRYITLRQGISIETEWLAWCQESIDLLES
ncbi:MAG: hypothetical protein LH613_07550 [Chamaesiphon sp.]|nr:hypothetical protein [Chamaesiphon sp.]